MYADCAMKPIWEETNEKTEYQGRPPCQERWRFSQAGCCGCAGWYAGHYRQALWLRLWNLDLGLDRDLDLELDLDLDLDLDLALALDHDHDRDRDLALDPSRLAGLLRAAPAAGRQ